MKLFTVIAIVLSTSLSISFSSLAQLSDVLRLTVSSGSYSDQTAVRFLKDATSAFDSQYDAYKWLNGGSNPNLCSVIDGQTYAINALQGLDQPISQYVPLQLEVAFSATYTFAAEQLGPFNEECAIILIDKLKRTNQDLRTLPNYTFDFQVGDPADRFELYFEIKQPKKEESTDKTVFTTAVFQQNDVSMDKGVNIYSNGDRIIVDFDQAQSDVSVNINNLAGHTFVQTTIDNQAKHWEFISSKQDLYIVSLVVDGELYTAKVYAQP